MGDCKRANSSPLGFVGFGLTVILLNIHNAGFLPVTTATAAMGIFCGGVAQLIAGLLEYRRGSTFAMTAFLAYGFFWITLVVSWYLPVAGAVVSTDSISSGVYLTLWGVFTFFMFIGTLNLNKALQVIFGSMTLLYAFLAIGNFAQSSLMITLGGFAGIICGVASIYLAMADVLNEVYAKTVLPVGVKKAA